MRTYVWAAVSCGLLLWVPLAAETRGDEDSRDSGSERVLVTGTLDCFGPAAGPADVTLAIGGGALGIESRPTELTKTTNLGCQEVVTRTALPTPLCASSLRTSQTSRFVTFVCSGPAGIVVDTLGKLGKTWAALP